ncbi:hypothetical protein EBB07_16720 [Paenibacillaceae bacterium]|nr:hypothetical protein EBB07_16720 [Paenibacillaceae bacterium]
MKLGVAYYPEHVASNQWGVDLKSIRAAGIRRVRIGEFAWSEMETDEGKYQWDWLDQFIDLAKDHDIEVVLCTPTAAPPIWLVEKYPEVLPVDAQGRRNVFGGRQHRCYNAPAYQLHSQRIVEQLAKRYGNHPNVAAWQLDNEFGGEQKRCYCGYCKLAFQNYLTDNYKTIEQLNKRWGTVFWSQTYQRFDQIAPPMTYTADLQVKHHPSLEMNFTRFSSRSISAFSRMQTALLRQWSPGRPVSTNVYYFQWGDNIDWIDLTEDMDAVGIDVYSDELYENAFYADFMYSLKPDNAWFLEYGTGGELKGWLDGIDQARRRRNNWFFIFKLKPFSFGQEQGLQELMTITGQPTEKYAALQKWSQLRSVEDARLGTEQNQIQDGDLLVPSGIGLYFSFESSWVYTISQWDSHLPDRLKYTRYMVHVVYQSIFAADQAHRIVYSADQLEGLQTLILPRHIIYDAVLESRLLQFMENGGTVVATSDLFQKNSDNVYLTEMPTIYAEVLGRQSFITDEKNDEPIIQHVLQGRGELIIVHKDTTLEEWQAVWNGLEGK